MTIFDKLSGWPDKLVVFSRMFNKSGPLKLLCGFCRDVVHIGCNTQGRSSSLMIALISFDPSVKSGRSVVQFVVYVNLERFNNDDARLRQRRAHKVDNAVALWTRREKLQNAVATSYLGRQLAHRKLKILVSSRFRALSRPHFTSRCVC